MSVPAFACEGDAALIETCPAALPRMLSLRAKRSNLAPGVLTSTRLLRRCASRNDEGWSRDESCSGLPDRLDHRGGHRLLRRLAAPDHQLERRVESLAFRERDVDELLDLLGARGGDPAQEDRVAERRRGVARGEIEMSEP